MHFANKFLNEHQKRHALWFCLTCLTSRPISLHSIQIVVMVILIFSARLSEVTILFSLTHLMETCLFVNVLCDIPFLCVKLN